MYSLNQSFSFIAHEVEMLPQIHTYNTEFTEGYTVKAAVFDCWLNDTKGIIHGIQNW